MEKKVNIDYCLAWEKFSKNYIKFSNIAKRNSLVREFSLIVPAYKELNDKEHPAVRMCDDYELYLDKEIYNPNKFKDANADLKDFINTNFELLIDTYKKSFKNSDSIYVNQNGMVDLKLENSKFKNKFNYSHKLSLNINSGEFLNILNGDRCSENLFVGDKALYCLDRIEYLEKYLKNINKDDSNSTFLLNELYIYPTIEYKSFNSDNLRLDFKDSEKSIENLDIFDVESDIPENEILRKKSLDELRLLYKEYKQKNDLSLEKIDENESILRESTEIDVFSDLKVKIHHFSNLSDEQVYERLDIKVGKAYEGLDAYNVLKNIKEYGQNNYVSNERVNMVIKMKNYDIRTAPLPDSHSLGCFIHKDVNSKEKINDKELSVAEFLKEKIKATYVYEKNNKDTSKIYRCIYNIVNFKAIDQLAQCEERYLNNNNKLLSELSANAASQLQNLGRNDTHKSENQPELLGRVLPQEISNNKKSTQYRGR